MNTHANNLFGFNQGSARGSFSPMSSDLIETEDTNTIIGDPITQNFGGGPLPKHFPSWSKETGNNSEGYYNNECLANFLAIYFHSKKI